MILPHRGLQSYPIGDHKVLVYLTLLNNSMVRFRHSQQFVKVREGLWSGLLEEMRISDFRLSIFAYFYSRTTTFL